MFDQEELVLRDLIFGLRAELDEANYQQKKVEVLNVHLNSELLVLNNQIRVSNASHKDLEQLVEKLLHDISLRDAEIEAIRQSTTWRIGTAILIPFRWVKRFKS